MINSFYLQYSNKLNPAGNPWGYKENSKSLSFARDRQDTEYNLFGVKYKVPGDISELAGSTKAILVTIQNSRQGYCAGGVKINDTSILGVAHLFNGTPPENTLIRTAGIKNQGNMSPEGEIRLIRKDNYNDLALYSVPADLRNSKAISIEQGPLGELEQVYIISPHPDSSETLVIPAKNIPIKTRKLCRLAEFGNAASYIKLRPDIAIPDKITLEGFCGGAVVNSSGKLVGIIGKGQQSDEEHIFAMDADTLKKFIN